MISKLVDNPPFGKNKKDREHYIKTAGLTIKTGLDPKIQAAAQKSITKNCKPTDEAIGASPSSNRAPASSRRWPRAARTAAAKKHETAYNYNAEKTYAGGYGGFQNGSTMKAFTIAAAIQKGFPLTHRINSPAPST